MNASPIDQGISRIMGGSGYVQLSESEAREHPLYGVKGGLLALLIFQIVWVVSSLVLVAFDPASGFVPAQSVFGSFIAYWIVRKKDFLAVATLCVYPGLTTVGIVVMAVILAAGDGTAIANLRPEELFASGILLLFVRDIPITLYLFRSRRVNVTTRHRVSPADPFLIEKHRLSSQSMERQAEREDARQRDQDEEKPSSKVTVASIGKSNERQQDVVTKATEEATSNPNAGTNLPSADIGSARSPEAEEVFYYSDGIAQIGEISPMEKECPRCAEIIKLRARYCRYCSYEYSEEEFSTEQNTIKNSLEEIENRRVEEERLRAEEEKLKAEKEKKLRAKKELEKLEREASIPYRGYRIVRTVNTADGTPLFLIFEGDRKLEGHNNSSIEDAKRSIDFFKSFKF